MAGLSRRNFLEAGGASAALAFMAANGIKLKANPLGLPIGSQTYPHRARIQADGLKGFDALLKDMKAIGIEAVELCNANGYKDFAALADVKTTRKMLDDNGIRALSAHFNIATLRKQQQQEIDWALALGMTQMSTASLQGAVKDNVTTLDEVKQAADEYNKMGALAAKNGLKQALHNEGFENSLLAGRPPHVLRADGALRSEARVHAVPDVVDALDGHQPDSAVPHLPGACHLAPRAGCESESAAGVRLTGRGGRGSGAPAGGRAGGAGRGGGQSAAGSDDLEWGRIFEAGKIGGLQNFFVEQSWPLTQLSVAYLKALQV